MQHGFALGLVSLARLLAKGSSISGTLPTA
jgi:hypothetical protein